VATDKKLDELLAALERQRLELSRIQELARKLVEQINRAASSRPRKKPVRQKRR
jgi:hypothetical protein